MEVEEGTDFAAEGTCLVLVQGQLQVAGRGQLEERKKTGNTWSPRAPRLPSKPFFMESPSKMTLTIHEWGKAERMDGQGAAQGVMVQLSVGLVYHRARTKAHPPLLQSSLGKEQS